MRFVTSSWSRMALAAALLSATVGACSVVEGEPSTSNTISGNETDASANANADATSVVDGGDPGSGDAGADGSVVDGGARGVAVWSVDLTLPFTRSLHLAATNTHVAVASDGLTVVPENGQGKAVLPIGARHIRVVRAAGAKLVAAGIEGEFTGSSPGAFTAEVTPTGLDDLVVVPMVGDALNSTILMDAARNVGTAEAIDGLSFEKTRLRRFGPNGVASNDATFTEEAQNTLFYFLATTMGDNGAIASAGSLGTAVHVLVPGAAPFTYTMPVAFVRALAFGPSRIAMVSPGTQSSVLHVANFGGQLVDSAALDGVDVEALVMPNDHEVIVSGKAAGVVNSTRPVVRRYDFTSHTAVWTYHEPEVPNGATSGVALAVAPNGAIYVLMKRFEPEKTAAKIVRLTP